MTPEESEEAQRLLKAARSDLRAAEVLAADPEQGDDVIGFHVQQAVEKGLKVRLVSAGAEIPFRHDLRELLMRAAAVQIDVPPELADADWLTPWAVAGRYGTGGDPLDRTLALSVARAAVEWAGR